MTLFMAHPVDVVVVVVVQQVIQESETLTFVDLWRPASTDVEDDGPVSVRDALVFLGHAHFASEYSLPRSTSHGLRRHFLPPELPRPGKLVNVRVCHVNSPDDFYIQLVCTVVVVIVVVVSLAVVVVVVVLVLLVVVVVIVVVFVVVAAASMPCHISKGFLHLAGL